MQALLLRRDAAARRDVRDARRRFAVMLLHFREELGALPREVVLLLRIGREIEQREAHVLAERDELRRTVNERASTLVVVVLGKVDDDVALFGCAFQITEQ